MASIPLPRADTEGEARPYRIVAPRDHWYVICRSAELGCRPLARSLLGTPLVLFRDDAGQPAALLDRCAHRNVPLSAGRVLGGRLSCAYHGWEYDGAGSCRRIPALGDVPRISVPAHATAERHGYLWVFGRADAVPETPPPALPACDDPRYGTVRASFTVEATLFDTLENQVDVPHTSVVHASGFRAPRRNRIRARVRRFADRVEVQYVEPRPSGLAGRLLAPGGGTVVHTDRFIAPSTIQVDYRLGERAHVLITNLLTPVDDFTTRFHSTATYRFPLGRALSRFLGGIMGRRFLAEDARILALQTSALRRFGGERYSWSRADLFGPHIWQLLRRAERGPLAAGAVPESEESVELWL